MSFQEHVEERLQLAQNQLCLSVLSVEVMRIVIMIDCREELTEEIRKNDPYERPGVISWKSLAEQVPQGSSLRPLENAVLQLADWGLIQVVGRCITDPITPGPSAIRLTHAGRVCVGLSPASSIVSQKDVLENQQPWTILHSASLETLVLHSLSDFTMPILKMPRSGDAELERICGEIAIQLCTYGKAIINAFQIAESPLIERMLERCNIAKGPRYILVPEPTYLRLPALYLRAELHWIEPQPHLRKERYVLEQRVSNDLQQNPSQPHDRDICGVPDSEVAQPKRYKTKWTDLILDSKVRFQLEQSLKHAHYRLNVLPTLTGFGGKQAGYRLLLSGLPGTGKSMAAEALSNALDRPLVKLDLSSVLSKWLGETEKLIGQIFDIAEASGAVLVLDEAEALLRQRTSQGGGGGGLSTGVAYMLTRFDRYTGVLVATTNRIEDLDEAFFRRFDDYAIIPIPDRTTRTRMWQEMFNDEVADVNYKLLGRNFAISGGLIKGAVIRAKAWAMGLEKNLSTPFALASLSRELEKNNKSTNEVLVPEYIEEVEALLEGNMSEINRLL
jgi:hypothetical protein